MTQRVWMIAEAGLYTQLAGEGQLFVDPRRCEPDVAAAYAWMRAQMAERLPNYGGHFPWWAWVAPPAGRRRPDLRARWAYHTGWPPGTPCVRLELELADEEVLVSDFDEWHAVLNHGPLVETDAEWDRITALPEPQQTVACQATWPRMFELAASHDCPWWDFWHGADSTRIVQACFETLRLADVRAVTRFVARPPK
jgi:Domain of unknown function (DUF3841)